MAEGDILFPDLKTGYQNSHILFNIFGFQKIYMVRKKETHSQKTKELTEQDSDMTHLLGRANLTWNLNMFNILKTLIKMMRNIKDHIFQDATRG